MPCFAMKLAVAFCALFLVGVYSSSLNDDQKQQLRDIRNQCVAQSGLSPREIVLIIKAVRSAEKVVNASRCIVDKVEVLRQQDPAINEVVDITGTIVAHKVTGIVNKIVNNCDSILGPTTCQKIVQLIQLTIAQNAQQN